MVMLTAPSDEALQADIGWTKMFGFNGVRKHQKIEDPRWLYWCDRLGIAGVGRDAERPRVVVKSGRSVVG